MTGEDSKWQKKRANLTILSLSVGITALYYPSKFFFTIGLLYAWKSIWNPYNTGDSRTELHIFSVLKKCNRREDLGIGIRSCCASFLNLHNCARRSMFMVHTMLTCTSQQYIALLQLCTILHLLRITQRLLWKLTSATVFLTTPWQTTHHATVTAARPLVACYHRDARMQVTSDADKDSVLPLHMPFKKDTGNSQKWGSPFQL